MQRFSSYKQSWKKLKLKKILYLKKYSTYEKELRMQSVESVLT